MIDINRDLVWVLAHEDTSGDVIIWETAKGVEPPARFVMTLCNVKTNPVVFAETSVWDRGLNHPRKFYTDFEAYQKLKEICGYTEASLVVSCSLSKIKHYAEKRYRSIEKAVQIADELFLSL